MGVLCSKSGPENSDVVLPPRPAGNDVNLFFVFTVSLSSADNVLSAQNRQRRTKPPLPLPPRPEQTTPPPIKPPSPIHDFSAYPQEQSPRRRRRKDFDQPPEVSIEPTPRAMKAPRGPTPPASPTSSPTSGNRQMKRPREGTRVQRGMDVEVFNKSDSDLQI